MSVIFDYLDAVRAAVTEALPPVGRSFVAPGGVVAWDDCCDGQVWVRLASATPAPAPAAPLKASGDLCAVPWWTLNVVVGVIRCAHTIDDEGNAPTPRELSEDAESVLEDMWTILRVITCKVAHERMGTWTPVGPEGGCVGGEWSFTARIAGCSCDDDDE